ncbi:MAG: hypothetical protein VYD19_11465 [Myxococcota bacterium]|nr:hypothetical protein [Myxococcota bacterium]
MRDEEQRNPQPVILHDGSEKTEPMPDWFKHLYPEDELNPDDAPLDPHRSASLEELQWILEETRSLRASLASPSNRAREAAMEAAREVSLERAREQRLLRALNTERNPLRLWISGGLGLSAIAAAFALWLGLGSYLEEIELSEGTPAGIDGLIGLEDTKGERIAEKTRPTSTGSVEVGTLDDHFALEVTRGGIRGEPGLAGQLQLEGLERGTEAREGAVREAAEAAEASRAEAAQAAEAEAEAEYVRSAERARSRVSRKSARRKRRRRMQVKTRPAPQQKQARALPSMPPPVAADTSGAGTRREEESDRAKPSAYRSEEVEAESEAPAPQPASAATPLPTGESSTSTPRSAKMPEAFPAEVPVPARVSSVAPSRRRARAASRRVSKGQARRKGATSRDQDARAWRAGRGARARCLRRHHRGASTQVSFALSVDPSGRVVKARVIKADQLNTALRGCLVRAAEGLTFPRSGTSRRLRFPFKLPSR